MRPLLADIAAETSLRRAWGEVLANDAEDGVLAPGVKRFADGVDARLHHLSVALVTETYQADRLTEVPIPKSDGTTRTLHVPSVKDRIVERSIYEALSPIIDPELGPFSYGYRPGLGVDAAVRAVVDLRREGLEWVARTDIHDCFPTIPIQLLGRMLDALVSDPPLRRLVDMLLCRLAYGRGERALVPGLPQGSPLSPLWSNLVLARLDTAVAERGYPVVRYADDIVVGARNESDAWEAMRVVSQAAEDLGLSTGADKSEVMSFDEGFSFLGEDFGPRYPPDAVGPRLVPPERKVVFVALQGSRVRKANGRLLVESAQEETVLSVPSGTVSRIVCFGSVGISAGTRSWALSSGVETIYLSRRGGYLGKTTSGDATTNVSRLRAQLAFADDAERTRLIGRSIVDAKIRKQTVLLRRFARPESAEVVRGATGQMEQLRVLTTRAETRDELMGMEGAAAREYFRAMAAVVPDDMTFAGRSRQPPEDVVNAALSYGYAILLGECVSALASAGLDPAIGVLHAEQTSRPSLALDLMEEFRPMVVDQVVVSLVRSRQLRPEHGRREEQLRGVLLTKAGRETLVKGYELRMLQMTRGALPGFGGSLRRHVYRQAERLAGSVVDPGTEWSGLSWR